MDKHSANVGARIKLKSKEALIQNKYFALVGGTQTHCFADSLTNVVSSVLLLDYLDLLNV